MTIRQNKFIGKPAHYFDGDENPCHAAIINGPIEIEVGTPGDIVIPGVSTTDLFQLEGAVVLAGVPIDLDALTNPSYHPTFPPYVCPRE